MENLRVVIADDDAGMRLVMKKIIEKTEGFAVAGEAENGEEALKLTEELKPAVLFVDVEMPNLSGIECARQVQDLNPNIVIIFATAHDCYMGEAFELYAFDYLVKPFKTERVIQTLERIRESLSMRRESVTNIHLEHAPAVEGRLMLKHKDGVSFLNLEEILLIQREDRATVIYTSDGGRYVTADTLSEMDERLPDDLFFRCHKSYIVNLNKIRDITPYGRWTYVLRLEGTEQDALITHDKYEELSKMFC